MKKWIIITRFLVCVFTFLMVSCTELPFELPDDQEDISFVVFGDIRQGYGIYSRLANIAGEISPLPCAALYTGDIMLRTGNEVEWMNFWTISEPVTSKMPCLMARGNHEGNSAEEEAALRQYGHFPEGDFYYSRQTQDIAFIILDNFIYGEKHSVTGDQFLWLQQELKRIDQDTTIKYLFILMHQPLFPQGNYYGTTLVNAGALHDLFKVQRKLKAVFAGHDHVFNHYFHEGVHYITTACSGEPLYHGRGGDYFHFTKVCIYREEEKIRIKTIGIYKEVYEDFYFK